MNITDVLARLDADISDAEARLAELRVMRKGAEAFIRYAGDSMNVETKHVESPADPSHGHAGSNVTVRPFDAATAIFDANPGRVMRMDDVVAEGRRLGISLDRDKIRDGIHYAVRKGLFDKAGRGAWILRNAEAPGLAGASDTEESRGDSSLEEGDSGGTEALHDHDGLALDAHDPRGSGLSSSAIGGDN